MDKLHSAFFTQRDKLMTEPSLMLGLINFAVCTAGAFVCLCRLGRMSAKTKNAIIAQYAICMVFFSVSGLSGLCNQPATFIQVLMSFLIALKQVVGYIPWRNGQPNYAIKHEGAQ